MKKIKNKLHRYLREWKESLWDQIWVAVLFYVIILVVLIAELFG